MPKAAAKLARAKPRKKSSFTLAKCDAMTFVGTAVMLGLVAVVAGAVPALRALRVDPLQALRTD